jgi:hypothetical protein
MPNFFKLLTISAEKNTKLIGSGSFRGEGRVF